MPENKGESVFFTAITAWMMVYVMTIYNHVIATGEFVNGTFLIALKNMWIEYIIIFLLAFFVAGKIAPKLAFRVVKPGQDRQIFIIFGIQTATVCVMVFFATFIALYHSNGYNVNFFPNYLLGYMQNFKMALPLQLFIVGPIARFVFRSIFRRKKKA